MHKHNSQKLMLLIFLSLIFCASDALSQDPPSGATARARRTFKLQVEVSAGADKVQGASVFLTSEENGVSFSKQTRTNRDGIASASAVPEGRLRIQVIARECETFGSVITIAGDQTVQVALVKRPSSAPSP